MKYEKLSDALQVNPELTGLADGKTKIWYWKNQAGLEDLLMGSDWLKKKNKLPTRDTISNTHVLLGSVKEIDPNLIYDLMQGETWSPNGEANDMIIAKGLRHTSMSVGDVIELEDGQLIMVDMTGFYRLEGPTKKEESIFLKLTKDLQKKRLFLESKIETRKGSRFILRANIDHYSESDRIIGIFDERILVSEKRRLEKEYENYSYPTFVVSILDRKASNIGEVSKDFERLCVENSIEFVYIGAKALELFGFVRGTLDLDVVIKPEDFDKVKDLCSEYNFHVTTQSSIIQPAIIHSSGMHLHVFLSGKDIPNLDLIKGDLPAPSIEGLILTKLLYVRDPKNKQDIQKLLDNGKVDVNKLQEFLVDNGYSSMWSVFQKEFERSSTKKEESIFRSLE